MAVLGKDVRPQRWVHLNVTGYVIPNLALRGRSPQAHPHGDRNCAKSTTASLEWLLLLLVVQEHFLLLSVDALKAVLIASRWYGLSATCSWKWQGRKRSWCRSWRGTRRPGRARVPLVSWLTAFYRVSVPQPRIGAPATRTQDWTRRWATASPWPKISHPLVSCCCCCCYCCCVTIGHRGDCGRWSGSSVQ